MHAKRKRDVWTIVSIVIFLMVLLFLVYPMFGLLKQSVVSPEGTFTLGQFGKFFSANYYTSTIWNSVKVTICVTIVSLLFGVPLSYFYSFYKLKGAKVLFILSILCSMSAPFIGAYSWIMLLGRSGIITEFLEETLGIAMGSIYGFGGILFVQAFKFFPLVFIYMNGAFKNIDNSLMEASANMGVTGIQRIFRVVLKLVMPTILAASLLVFMRAFADFGTPMLLGEGYMTFPILIYRAYLGENGADYAFAAAVSVIAIIITAIVFFIQKWSASKFRFAINALHPVEKKEAKGVAGFFMHLYCYLLIAIAILPQAYIILLSFRNYKGSIAHPGFSFTNYEQAAKHLLGRSIKNTALIGIISLVLIIILAIMIAYIVVRRASVLNHTIDTLTMLPYIMPGAVIGIAILSTFSKQPFGLSGTITIMVISFVIRRLPYTIRSANATLSQIPMNIEEAAISLGTSKLKTFFKITVPMMSNGIISGAILSWVSIVTELSSSVIMYNNKNITLTVSAYVAISRGNYGMAAAFSAVLTVVTIISLIIYIKVAKEDAVAL